MAFHQQIPLLIDLYAFFRIPPKGKRVVIRQNIPPLSHISLESLHVLYGHLSAGRRKNLMWKVELSQCVEQHSQYDLPS